MLTANLTIAVAVVAANWQSRKELFFVTLANPGVRQNPMPISVLHQVREEWKQSSC